MKEIISIKITKFLTNDYVTSIALKQWGSEEPQWINRSRQYIFEELINNNDCFGVVAVTADDKIIGRMHCVKNKTNPKLWYYGDLFVATEYRCNGIATRLINTAVDYLSEIGATELVCYVEPENTISHKLQIRLGFVVKNYKVFNDFITDGETMYSLQIPTIYSVIPATVNEAYFVRVLFFLNQETHKMDDISYAEWQKRLSAKDKDESNFLICKGAVPVGYMQIKGIITKQNPYISMFIVAPQFNPQEISTIAIKHADNFVAELGLRKLDIPSRVFKIQP